MQDSHISPPPSPCAISIQSGHTTIHLRLPPQIQQILAGKKRALLNTLCGQTGVQTYLPEPAITLLMEKEILDKEREKGKGNGGGDETMNEVNESEKGGGALSFGATANTIATASDHEHPLAETRSGPQQNNANNPAVKATRKHFPDVMESEERVVLTGTMEATSTVHTTLTRLSANKVKMIKTEKVSYEFKSACRPSKLAHPCSSWVADLRHSQEDRLPLVSSKGLYQKGHAR